MLIVSSSFEVRFPISFKSLTVRPLVTSCHLPSRRDLRSRDLAKVYMNGRVVSSPFEARPLISRPFKNPHEWCVIPCTLAELYRQGKPREQCYDRQSKAENDSWRRAEVNSERPPLLERLGSTRPARSRVARGQPLCYQWLLERRLAMKHPAANHFCCESQ